MSRALLAALVVVFYVLHQDFWFWNATDPLFFGLFPVGLFYHLVYSLAAAGLMWLLVHYGWPTHLEQEAEQVRQPGGRR